MARRTLSYPTAVLYPGIVGTNVEIIRTVRARYPGLPPCTRRSVVADLLRSIILSDGGRGKRGTVALAEQRLEGWLDKLDYGTNVAPGKRVPSSPTKAKAQLRRDLFATYDAAMKAAEGGTSEGSTKAPESVETKATQEQRAQENREREPDELPEESRTYYRCQSCGRPRTPREIRYRPTQPSCYHCTTKGVDGDGRSIPPTFPPFPPPITPESMPEPSNGTERAPEPIPSGNPERDYLAWSKQVRAMCERRNADGHPLDDWSMRPTLDGLRLIKAGCPIEAVKDAATMHFPQDARQEVGVEDFDFVGYGISSYLERAASARVPLFLVGPKGTGKTTHAKRLADSLGTAFGMVSVTAGTSPSAFYGRPIIGSPTGEVVPSRFQTVYTGGGVFLFDEIDAADPNILLIVNAALADGGRWSNPQTGEEHDAHPDFIPVAAGNTIGLGASRDYTGRDRLDAATLDRFCAGRVRVKLDDDLETTLAERIMGEVSE